MKAITAKRLDEWSITTHDSKRLLSNLVSRLARATAPDRRDLRFPSGDSFNIPNYDGRLISEKGAAYVPVGQSVWEFGAGDEYVEKARDDIEARSKDPRGIVKEETTLVFCTSREWNASKHQLTTFEAEMRSAYPEWKDIKIVDAVMLEHWCEDAPAVADQFARELGWTPQEGAVGLTTFWDRYAADFDPQLVEGVALAARAEEAKEIVERLQSQAPGTVQLQSDSTSEVVAFVVAAIRTAEEETRKYLEARCIVVESETAADHLAANPQLIFILTGQAAARASYLGKTHIVVVPLANDPMNTSASIRRLTRPTRHEFEDALKTMFPDEGAARRNALISLGSLSVLRRHCWSVARPRPMWHTNADLIPATLAGTWDVRREADRQVLAELARVENYDDYEKKLRPLLTGDDGPIERVGDVWRMQAPFDALVWMADHVTKADIDALEAVTQKVFAERDKNLDAPDDQAFEDRRFTRSDWLRKGLATSLLHFAVLDGNLPVKGLPTQSAIDALVAKIPGLSDDPDTLANLRDVLPTLAEAAPRPLLSALERLLEGKKDQLAALFRGRGAWGDRAYHTGLLWGLEALAWDPAYLEEIAILLARLAEIDPGGKLLNRPLNSLTEIFLLWQPSTYASRATRDAVLDKVCSIVPAVAWPLIEGLLPGKKNFSSSTHKPLLREIERSNEVITRGALADAELAMIRRALPLLGHVAERWMTAINLLPIIPTELRETLLSQLCGAASSMDASQKQELWGELRDEVARHTKYRDATWSMSDEDLEHLRGVLDSLESGDEIERIRYLFDDHWPGILMDDDDGDDDDEARKPTSSVDRADLMRVRALSDLLKSQGSDGACALAKSVKLPALVAIAWVAALDVVADIDAVVDRALNEELPLEFFANLSTYAFRKFGEPWKEGLFERIRASTLPLEHGAVMLAGLQESKALWEEIDTLGPDVEAAYWKVISLWFPQVEAEGISMLADKMMKHGRAASGLMSLRDNTDKLQPETVFKMLDQTIGELNSKTEMPNNMFVHAVETIFKALSKRPDADIVEIARLEYRYLPMFGHRDRLFVLGDLMASDPGFYTSILSDVFLPASGEKREIPKDEQRRGEIGYRLLMEFKKLPGTNAENQVDEDALNKWVDEVRRLCAENDRAEIGDVYVGHALAHSPDDPQDSAWPHAAVRRIIERLSNKRIEDGIMTERFNMRGVVTKAMFEGGAQERHIADRIRGWARIAAATPRTANMLNRMAENYDDDAKGEDERAEQDRRRF